MQISHVEPTGWVRLGSKQQTCGNVAAQERNSFDTTPWDPIPCMTVCLQANNLNRTQRMLSK